LPGGYVFQGIKSNLGVRERIFIYFIKNNKEECLVAAAVDHKVELKI